MRMWLALIALSCVASFLAGRASMLDDLSELSGRVEQQNIQAGQRLKELTAERDEKQARLDRLAADQEKKDEQARDEISRLAGELERRPFRVRVVTSPRDCGGSSAGEGSARPAAGAGDSASAYGVLPAENTRRLDAALIEVEQLSAAYRSCRAMAFDATR